MSDYDFTSIERKWVKKWDENKTFKVTEDESFPVDKRLYVLDMFPYPSGSGLHVGHPEGYTATDIYSRYKKMCGYNVLHPMGFDAFGLPAENYAIQTGTHPSITTYKNIDTFRTQIKTFGFCYDWDREIATCDSDYYKWTQWIFLQLFKKGLAYESDMPINFCPKCKTGLANEEVKDGKCDRCDSPIERKRIRQWMLKITAYAERLLNDLDDLDWNDSIKLMQRNWIGKSEGAEVEFTIDLTGEKLEIYTTRPDTLFGVTYMVMAPEHPLVHTITTAEHKAAVLQYIEEASSKSDLDRTELSKEKTGVFTGGYAINPVNGAKIPIWISDYVLISYGTGAIMAVPGHDARDFEFATKFNIPIIQVVSKDGTSQKLEEAFTEEGIAVNSGNFSGMKTEDFKQKITQWLEENKIGKKSINYKLRDWVFSRQRYWGEPIPLIHCEKCGIVPMDEKDLPLLLPDVDSYKPSGTGESPLANIEEWVNTTCPVCGGKGKRETNTMPQWAGSCWYYLRFIDPANKNAFADRKKLDYWGPVDLYVGGAEHAVLHLLYSRFWHKVLFDIGVVSEKEPFIALRNQGMILGENGEKMSKSRGNVINPDDVIKEHGADTLRMYEMFMGPLNADKPWSTKNIIGIRRFLEKSWKLIDKNISDNAQLPEETEKLLHKTIKITGEKLDNLEFNTAISQLMILINSLSKEETLNTDVLKTYIQLLHPFAPFITEELWEKSGVKTGLLQSKWPIYDPAKCIDDVVTVVFQINGKLRDKADLPKGASQEEAIKEAKNSEKMKPLLEGKTIIKEIVVQDRLVNFVVQ
ncbi:MAG: leucine--tRNA ligase [Spirochaetes bacterium GWF1_31_7]|nr:MAG: leucine--tRNA ligase [Spirochaetes bacterium GWE1_32_154]OHD46975.1 MAG: leucine--tRNA ligase [Spirochaetes bacterium GWF1_31_7]OHD49755.1 MAG: leucine--tRNA ligase [Spirochaetes bacterium GWE2_31_10]OHD75535.1 MAG: leucine--tRNA ligase [Spirochaetes bacterium RIFOXYB1_FULL_32_8]HBD95516.1 leucine--tRNA ligase [Spirochaetia bacterium]